MNELKNSQYRVEIEKNLNLIRKQLDNNINTNFSWDYEKIVYSELTLDRRLKQFIDQFLSIPDKIISDNSTDITNIWFDDTLKKMTKKEESALLKNIYWL